MLMLYCKEQVWMDTRWPRRRQCARKAVRDGYCNQHHPDSVKERQKTINEKFERQWQRRRKELAGPSWFEVLKLIAEGHDDPRALAADAIKDYGDP